MPGISFYHRFFAAIICLHFLSIPQASAQKTDSIRLSIPVTTGEYWWLGIINHGNVMPLTQGYHADLHANLYGNQAQPLLLSSKGRIVWSATPFSIRYDSNAISLVKDTGTFFSTKSGLTKGHTHTITLNPH